MRYFVKRLPIRLAGIVMYDLQHPVTVAFELKNTIDLCESGAIDQTRRRSECTTWCTATQLCLGSTLTPILELCIKVGAIVQRESSAVRFRPA